MRKLLIKLALLLPIPIAIGLTNYFVDPIHIFSNNNYIDGMVRIIMSGKNIANVANYDDRLFQKKIIERLLLPNDTIVLGSSRVMMIRASLFPESRFFNNWVSDASLHDILAIINMYEKRKLLPHQIIIGLDAMMLNANNNAKKWQTVGSDYNEMKVKLFKNENQWKLNNNGNMLLKDKIFLLFSGKVFWQSIFNLNTSYYSTDDIEAEVPIKMWDGSYVYPRKYNQLSLKNKLSGIKLSISDDFLKDYFKLDEKYSQLLEKFIDYLLSKNIKIVIYLGSYHPLMYLKLTQHDSYRIIEKIEIYYSQLAKKRNIKLIGSFNPTKLHLNGSDFYDAYHLKENSIAKLFNNLANL